MVPYEELAALNVPVADDQLIQVSGIPATSHKSKAGNVIAIRQLKDIRIVDKIDFTRDLVKVRSSTLHATPP